MANAKLIFAYSAYTIGVGYLGGMTILCSIREANPRKMFRFPGFDRLINVIGVGPFNGLCVLCWPVTVPASLGYSDFHFD